MDPIWQRIDAELKARKKTWPWLYKELGYARARVANWKVRGIPTSAHAAIALALGESVDWLIGAAESRRKNPESLPPMALRLAQEFALIPDAVKQLDAYTECLNVIARARGI